VNPVAKLPDETREHVVVLLREQRSYRDIVEQTGTRPGSRGRNGGRLWSTRSVRPPRNCSRRPGRAGRDAQAFMTAVAIGVDKAQLLSGGVTSRHEQLDAQRRRDRVAVSVTSSRNAAEPRTPRPEADRHVRAAAQ
jgi:hypothetical protein